MADALPVKDGEPLVLRDIVPVTLTVGEPLAEREAREDSVSDGLPEPVAVADPVGHVVELAESDTVTERVSEPVTVPVGECVTDGEPLALTVALPDSESLLDDVAVRDAGAVKLAVPLPLTVPVPLSEPVALPVGLPLSEGVPEPLCVGVAEPVSEPVALSE